SRGSAREGGAQPFEDGGLRRHRGLRHRDRDAVEMPAAEKTGAVEHRLAAELGSAEPGRLAEARLREGRALLEDRILEAGIIGEIDLDEISRSAIAAIA